MGYAISAYRVNLERVESRFGIADKPKRRKIINRCAARAASIDELGSYKTDPPKFMEIVEELLDGKATHERFGFMYWYAIECFMEELGREMVPRDNYWEGRNLDLDFFYKHFSLWSIPAPMTIPTPDDFPTVFVLPAERITEEFMTTTVNAAVPEYFQRGQLQSWLKNSKQYKQDLVLFYY
jgi:hypothetical protein